MSNTSQRRTRRGRGGQSRFAASVRKVMRRTDHDLVLGRKLVLTADPPAMVINPIYPITLHFVGNDSLDLSIKDVRKGVATRISCSKIENIVVAIQTVKVYSSKANDTVTLTISTSVGYPGNKQFVDHGTPTVEARVGYEWPRDNWDTLFGGEADSFVIARIRGSAVRCLVHCHWRYALTNPSPTSLATSVQKNQESTDSWADEYDEEVLRALESSVAKSKI